MLEIASKPSQVKGQAVAWLLRNAAGEWAKHGVNKRLKEKGVEINRPPRDGRMAFVKSPDNISIEILQKGDALEPAEPWLSMENIGTW